MSYWFKTDKDGSEGDPKIGKMIGHVVLAILAVVVLFGSWFTVPNGEQAVVFSSTSGLKSETYGPGIHLKTPLVDSPTRYNVKSQLYTVEADAASHDLQQVSTTVAVQYHPDASYVSWLHANIGHGYKEVVIAPGVQETVKAITAKHDASDLITNRSAVEEQIRLDLSSRLAGSHIMLDQLSITNFKFSDQFEQAIEAKVTAEQNALAAKNKLAQVEYEAEQKVAEARGQAEAAQELANATQGEQGQTYLFLQWLQHWDGHLPTTMAGDSQAIIMLPPGMSQTSTPK